MLRRVLAALFLVVLLGAPLTSCFAGEAAPPIAGHDGHAVVATDGHADVHGEHGPSLGETLPLWSLIPFIGILLSIAVFPLVAPHVWHHHFPKISAGWALLFAVPFLIAFKGVAVHEVLHIYLIDYIPFIILLWALYTISGGIYVRGSMMGKPVVNLAMIIIGTLFASWIGTTGAAMVMIRPLLRANAKRKHRAHTVVFFIFLVANIGGSLTPLGDPPLFLGFLHGVPFFWTMHLLPHMLTAAAILAVIYFLVDTWFYSKEDKAAVQVEKGESLGLEGAHNFLFLAGVVGGVLMSGIWKPEAFNLLGVHMGWQNVARDGLLIGMGLLSLLTTTKVIREKNEFGWFPIKEVAYLFAGIFMTIIPALLILKAGEHGALASLVALVTESVHYFWMTGILSSFLDNAPTYLTFYNSALGGLGITEQQVGQALSGVPGAMPADTLEVFTAYLAAISAGAVFMGANTYIGNAPNFMVKSIAEESGVAMPSFFGYMFKYSIPILIPVFFVITYLFFT
jgi:Na+/H+ antiporter NhaD/arsenite permease-like protein